MSCELIPTPEFIREAKILTKKYRSLRKELFDLEHQLTENPELGTSLGNNCRKIRLAVKSKGKGKSGGLRIITHIIVRVQTTFDKQVRLYLLKIYDKSDYENISEKELQKILIEIKEQERGKR